MESLILRKKGRKKFIFTPFRVAALATLLFILILTIVAMTSLKLYGRFDLTATKRYSLSEQTVHILENTRKEVKALGFFTPSVSQQEETSALLKLFSDTTRFFSYEIINPEKNPGRTRQFGKIVPGTLVLESGKRWEKLRNPDEASIVSAIIRITQEESRKVYFTIGHGELYLDDTTESGLARTKNMLESIGYDVSAVNLLKTASVPSDADVIVISGPRKDFFIDELDELYAYVKKGGSLLVMIDPLPLPGIEGFTRRFGIHLGNGVIIDKSRKLAGSDFLVTLVDQYSTHEITEEIDSVSIFPLSRSVQGTGLREEGITLFPLVRTSEASWLETNVMDLFQKGIGTFDELADERGPLILAIAGEIEGSLRNEQQRYGRIVVYGDSDFIKNTYFDQGANGDLFISSIFWLTKEKDLSASPPMDREFSPIILTKPQIQLLFWLAVVLLPLFALVTGVLVIRKVRWQG